jgi:hypothetical protein
MNTHSPRIAHVRVIELITWREPEENEMPLLVPFFVTVASSSIVASIAVCNWRYRRGHVEPVKDSSTRVPPAAGA